MTMRSLAPLPEALFEKFPTLQMFNEDELSNFGDMIICNRSGNTTIAFEVDPDFIIPLLRKFSVPISMELFQWASTAASFIYFDLAITQLLEYFKLFRNIKPIVYEK